MNDWDPIFKAGIHTSSTGQTREWSESDLVNLVNNTVDEPPIVIHHPKDQSKAIEFGKIARLKRVGGELLAQYRDVPEILSKAVNQGLKLAKSVSIDPLSMKIRHVGLLGANQPPAVEGLGPVSFSAGNNNDDSDNEGEPLLTYFFNQQPKDNDNPATEMPGTERTVDPKDQKIKDLEEKIKTLEADKTVDQLKTDLEHAKNELKEEKTAHQATKEEFSKFKKDREDEKLKSRVDALAESGRIKPAEKEKVLGYAKVMSSDSTPMEFSKPDGSKEVVSPGELYLRDLEALPENKDGLLAEFAAPDRAGHASYSEPDDWSKDINDFA